MTQPQEPEYAAPGPPPAQPQPTARLAPPRRSCMSRAMGFIGWIVTVVLSAALAIAAAAAILFYVFGFNLSTPGQIRQSSADVATIQSESQALQTEVALLRTASAEQVGGVNVARERVDDLEAKVAAYEQQAAELAGQAATAAALARDLDENIALAATIQAQAREGQVLVSVVATVQADNTGRLSDLQLRTDRIARFLQRLGDLAGDLSSQDGTPAPAETPAPTETPTAEVTPTP
ncbi:hypothetical protein K2Z83_08640 [Oscillochloris sp. ZM17-4]|uniref:hypothetical protein n=1 Tax=Oscillochloris sp. ZM17-4 TaxID=2866714 RepID=UPI001C73DF5B|nr:hypothetical protein [Oscillochloris sp. ZM17-4]MBX0327742.1 hypothetical protein [Oscillochloris sp. ZM17-4]